MVLGTVRGSRPPDRSHTPPQSRFLSAGSGAAVVAGSPGCSPLPGIGAEPSPSPAPSLPPPASPRSAEAAARSDSSPGSGEIAPPEDNDGSGVESALAADDNPAQDAGAEPGLDVEARWLSANGRSGSDDRKCSTKLNCTSSSSSISICFTMSSDSSNLDRRFSFMSRMASLSMSILMKVPAMIISSLNTLMARVMSRPCTSSERSTCTLSSTMLNMRFEVMVRSDLKSLALGFTVRFATCLMTTRMRHEEERCSKSVSSTSNCFFAADFIDLTPPLTQFRTREEIFSWQ
mmetsp:Transcript_70659/g.188599  ORF Transcript_70659/g.188599 Transcript_70659/m.188599 type:complete len:290 (+) Transcript_70659:204-1073(+)